MDSVVTWLRNTFATGIRAMPSFQLGDQVAMLIDTKQELDDLPTTESEGEE